MEVQEEAEDAEFIEIEPDTKPKPETSHQEPEVAEDCEYTDPAKVFINQIVTIEKATGKATKRNAKKA